MQMVSPVRIPLENSKSCRDKVKRCAFRYMLLIFSDKKKLKVKGVTLYQTKICSAQIGI